MLPSLLLSTLLATAATPAAARVVARGCGGHDLHAPSKRDLEEMMRRQTSAAPTDVASLKQITDPVQQCTPYSYPAVANVQASYPTIWETATIPTADTEARALFERIEGELNAKLPNASPKPATGAPGSNYNPSDPDCWWTWQGCTTPDPALGIPADLYDIPEPNSLALTIDDGPNCSQNAFYEFLREQNQKASMYFIGSNVVIWPLQALMAHEDGHEICVHTWSHQLMTSLTNEQVFAELYYTREIIKDVIGVTPRCWRPAQGDVDNRVRVIAAGLNLTNILWTDDTDDWRAQAPGSTVTPADIDTNYQNIINAMQNGTFATKGSVLLAHQSTNFTMSKLVEWIPRLKSAFTHVVPFASAYNWTTPYAESNEAFPSFEQYIKNETASVPSDGGSGPTGTLSSGTAPSGTSAGSGAGGSSTGTGAPSGTTTGAGAGAATSTAAAGRAVQGGLAGVVFGAVLAWASI